MPTLSGTARSPKPAVRLLWRRIALGASRPTHAGARSRHARRRSRPTHALGAGLSTRALGAGLPTHALGAGLPTRARWARVSRHTRRRGSPDPARLPDRRSPYFGDGSDSANTFEAGALGKPMRPVRSGTPAGIRDRADAVPALKLGRELAEARVGRSWLATRRHRHDVRAGFRPSFRGRDVDDSVQLDSISESESSNPRGRRDR